MAQRILECQGTLLCYLGYPGNPSLWTGPHAGPLPHPRNISLVHYHQNRQRTPRDSRPHHPGCRLDSSWLLRHALKQWPEEGIPRVIFAHNTCKAPAHAPKVSDLRRFIALHVYTFSTKLLNITLPSSICLLRSDRQVTRDNYETWKSILYQVENKTTINCKEWN